MIHIDRSRVPVPDIFSSPMAESKRQCARNWFMERNLNKLRQERYGFEAKIWLEAKQPLDELFQYKCAYCEKDLRREVSVVNHFRPFGDCIGLDGKTFPDGYWWLAYEWDNLYLACMDCVSIKGNRFPAKDPYLSLGKQDEGPLPKVLHNQEHALLLDPCYDEPEQHIQFLKDGTTKSITPPNPYWESEAAQKIDYKEIEDFYTA